jgi:hypothetical protein
MLGLTMLGIIHTIIAILAVLFGCAALIFYKKISFANFPGRWFAIFTTATCLTGFGIFQRGGFGDAHVLGIVTLIFIAIAAVMYWGNLSGNYKFYIAPCSLLISFFLHFIPALVETFTRLPVDSPLFSGPTDPALQKIVGLLMSLLVIALIVQILVVRSELRNGSVNKYAQKA